MVQARRTPHAKEIDSGLKAPIAKNVEQWLSAPNRYDLPDVDMNKPKEAEKKREPDKPFEPKPLTHSEIQRRLAYHKVMGTTH
ncbi:MAG: hypothetical protein ABSG33_02440 [Candidatus Bathyarchaeia archaeon]|jgi:hypothetical protein